MSRMVEKGEMVYVLTSPAGETLTVTVLPTVEATFLMVTNVPALGNVLMVRVGVASFLFTNKYLPHASVPSVILVEMVETHPRKLAQPAMVTSDVMVLTFRLLIWAVVLDSDVPTRLVN